MTVHIEVPVSPRVSGRPHIGLPDWKLGQFQHQQSTRQTPIEEPTTHTDRQAYHSRNGHRRHNERREKRQSSNRSKQHRGVDNEKRGHEPMARRYQHAVSPRGPTGRRRQEAGDLQTQQEIEFIRESDNKHSQYDSNNEDVKNKQDRHQTTSAENLLFSFPWRWNTGPGEDKPNKKLEKSGVEDEKRDSGTEESRKGVPSVVFAIHDADGDGVSATSPISERKVHKRHHLHRRRHKEEVLPEDLRPIAPSPQVPVMVGNRHDPIPCSDSLIGSVSRRYTNHGPGGEATRKKPPNYRRPSLKNQTILDLTALESVSTYDLEQRYMVNEVQNILASSKQASERDQISLPKLDNNLDGSLGHNYYHASSTARVADHVTSHKGPLPGRIDGQIVYNLSESSQRRQSKVRASISAHTESISESLEKMRTNLREKQSILSHAVYDLKDKKRQQEAASSADRMRNSVNVSQRNPDTLPLLKNQNYISDIFSDIASKMTMNKSGKPGGTRSPSRSKGPYIPTVSAILNSKREEEREKKSTTPHSNRRGRTEAVLAGFLDPQPAYPIVSSDGTKYHHASRTDPKRSVHEDITSIKVNYPCSITSPITEQFSNILSPAQQSKSSLFLPNIRSRRSTPVADKTLPFRPSAAASPSTYRPNGESRSRFQSPQRTKDATRRSTYSETHNLHGRQDDERRGKEVQGDRELHGFPPVQTPSEQQLPWMQDTRDYQGCAVGTRFPSMQEIIDVTSQASSLRFKDVVDLTDQASNRDPTTTSKCQSRDVIDVTSLASSRLSKTTVKDVICVDEDSQGLIRSKRKLAAMPKRRRRRGPPPTRSTGQRRQTYNYDGGLHDRYNYREWDTKGYASRKEKPVGNLAGQDYAQCGDKDNCDDNDEHEIVFTPCPDANRGLFEGIWDMELPRLLPKEVRKEPMYKDAEPENKSPKEVTKSQLFQKPLPKNKSPTDSTKNLLYQDDSPKTKSPNEVPKELIFPNVPVRNKSQNVPPRSPREAPDRAANSQARKRRPNPPVSTLELKGPLFMSPYSQSRRRSLKKHQLQPPEVKDKPEKPRSPMEASAIGPLARTPSALTRASSRVARTNSPQVRSSASGIGRPSSPRTRSGSGSATSRVAAVSSPQPRGESAALRIGRTPTTSGNGRSSSPRPRRSSRGLAPPVPQATSSSAPHSRPSNRGRDPSVLPWARRSRLPGLSRRRDAPITAVNQREPEGTVSVNPIHGGAVLSDDQEDTEETDVPVPVRGRKERPPKFLPGLPQIVCPRPLRRASALSKKGLSSERSTETRSVTFREGDTLLGPKDPKIPNFISTDYPSVDTDISWRRNKSVRRNIHPWDKDSQSSSRQAFPNLSTRDVKPKRGSDKKRHGVEAIGRRKTRKNDESRKSSKSSSVKRSMYDEVLDVAAGQQVIILDDDASKQYEIFPADSPNQQRHKKTIWDDVSHLNRSDQSLGKYWETLGGSSVRALLRSNTEAISSHSKTRSRRSAKREADRERQRHDQAMFFDFLCF